MNDDRGTVDWRIVLVRPLLLVLLTLPLLVALNRVTAPMPAGTSEVPPWTAPIQRAQDALARGNVADAGRVARDAYRAGLTSGQWLGMIEVGDLYVRIAQGTAAPGAVAYARTAYLTALIRAERDGAVDGAVRAAEAFATLGDRDAADHSLRIAARLAARGTPAAAETYFRAAEALRARAIGGSDP